MRLIGDSEGESRLRFGMAAYDRALYRQLGDSWKEVVLSALIPAISQPVNAPILVIREDEESIVFSPVGTNSGFDNYGVADLLQMSSRLLFLKSTEFPVEELEQIVKWMLNLPSTSYRKYSYVSYGLASAIAAHPTLLESIPALNDADLYEIGAPLIFSLSRSPHKARLISLSEEVKLRHYQSGRELNILRSNYSRWLNRY